MGDILGAVVGPVGSSLLAFSQAKSAGKIAQKEAEIGAQSEELAAIQREGDRKARLAQSLATQTAGAGASGIAVFEGSPLAALQESISAEETATGRDVFQSRLSALTTRTRGKVTRKQVGAKASLDLGRSLFRTAATLGPLVPASGGGGGSPFVSAANPRGLAPGQGL